MIPILLLGLVGVWFWWSFRGSDARALRLESDQFDAKIAECEAVTERMPDSAAAWEKLGDVLRQAERYPDALSMYQYAADLVAQSPDADGFASGSGLDQKIRLTQLDLDESGTIGAGNAARMRQQICRTCGTLSLPNAEKCAQCGDILPVDTMRQVWDNDETRKPIVKAATEALVMLLIVVFALAIFDAMPLEIKGILLISTVMVLGWKLLRTIGGK